MKTVGSRTLLVQIIMSRLLLCNSAIQAHNLSRWIQGGNCVADIIVAEKCLYCIEYV